MLRRKNELNNCNIKKTEKAINNQKLYEISAKPKRFNGENSSNVILISMLMVGFDLRG